MQSLQATFGDPNHVPLFHEKGPPNYPWWTFGDLEACTGLFFDNLSTLLAVVGATLGLPATAGFITGGAPLPKDFDDAWEEVVQQRVLPATSFAILAGNLWYSWMAYRLAAHEQRNDTTAQPYGINTPACFVIIFSVILPLMVDLLDDHADDASKWADEVWKGAVSTTFISGMFEVAFSWSGGALKKFLSTAALYGPITAVGFVFLAFAPFVSIFAEPIVGLLPLAFSFTGYFSGVSYGKVPSALLIIGSGTFITWVIPGASKYFNIAAREDAVEDAEEFIGENKLLPGVGLGGFRDAEDYVSIVVPVALQSFILTAESVETAVSAGDAYPVIESMIADGVGTMMGAFFGSFYPTTVYIGHPTWKRMGASASYSVANGLLYLVLLNSGLFGVIFEGVSAEATGAILIFVGLLIVKQAFQLAPPRHYPALCIAIFPVLADWVSVNGAGTGTNEPVPGILNLGTGGGIMVGLVFTQIACDMIDRRYLRGAAYCALAAVFSLFGIMHGVNAVGPEGDDEVALGEVTVSTRSFGGKELNEGWRFAIAYTLLWAFCMCHHVAQSMGHVGPPVMDDSDGASTASREVEMVSKTGDKSEPHSMDNFGRALEHGESREHPVDV